MDPQTKSSHLGIKELAPADRPREKLLQSGPGKLTSSELLAIILGSGNREESAVQLCQRLLNACDNDLHELAKKSLRELQEFKGIGSVKAITIQAALELAKRRTFTEAHNLTQITNSHDAYQVVAPHLLNLVHEEFWVVLVKSGNSVVAKKCIASGGVSQLIVDVRIILKFAVEHLASGIILAHNHPSERAEPSAADLKLTSRLCAAAKLMDMSVLDHIIVTDRGYYSFADNHKLTD